MFAKVKTVYLDTYWHYNIIQLGVNKGLRKYTSKGLALEQDEN